MLAFARYQDAVYAITTILAFAAVIYFFDNDTSDDLEGFKGMFMKKPLAAGFLIFAIFSLAGIPPFPGFYAKFFIFKNVVASGYSMLALLAFICSFLGIFFYIRILVYVFMHSESETHGTAKLIPPSNSGTHNFWVFEALAISLVIMLVMAVSPQSFIQVF
ncbi:MAG: hypothetical protein HQM11_17485 [SAR324 cluster bacterium]|nr:hypothetical protein [SAR324 cluster bacterium]